ncbi:MAG: hypothetical protein JWN09_1506 [Microbacteriaceae bacterium]|jgi:hypothetical protein|nr:hypothetical protein [Microbacteriaceae bacterium]
MTYAEAFDLIEAGEGRWDVQHHGSLLIAGQVWRTRGGFDLLDWLDRPIGTFESIEDALRFLYLSTTAFDVRRRAG